MADPTEQMEAPPLEAEQLRDIIEAMPSAVVMIGDGRCINRRAEEPFRHAQRLDVLGTRFDVELPVAG